MLKNIWPVFLAGLLLIAFAAPSGVALSQPTAFGIDVANIDLGVSPREDFYRFANGGWLDQTEIPDDKSSYGTFTELYDLTTDQLLAILGETSAGELELKADSDQAKAVRIWDQGIDAAARDALGLSPLDPFLTEIDAIADLTSYHAFLEGAMFRGLSGSLPVGVSSDLRDSGINAVYLGGPWLGLPNRDYYLEEGNEEVSQAYIDTNAKLLQRLGRDADSALTAAQAIYAFEKALAETTLTREEEQDPELSYNPATVEEIEQRYPRMDWRSYLDELGIAGTDRIIVTQTAYLDQLDAILEETSIETLRDYLRVQLLWSFYNNLDLELEETAFTFFQALGGQSVMPPLDERALGQVNGLMGDALGKLYVDAHFPPEAKAEMIDLVDGIVTAFGDRLERNE